MFREHPSGLRILFFTEMWERFSYYGMRGILVLFITASIESGGLGLDAKTGAAIYGLYTAMVYLLALPGGWIADRIMGQRNAVFLGGCIIAVGHFSMAVPSTLAFYIGLILIVLGTGLLKPNVSAIVGDLYPEKGAKRDAGFSIFYMGINIGAFAGPLICGYLGEDINWHLGFSAAGIGMIFGLIQYKIGMKSMGDAGLLKDVDGEERNKAQQLLKKNISILLGIGLLLTFLHVKGALILTLQGVAQATGFIIVGVALAYFAYVIIWGKLKLQEIKHVIVIFLLFIGSAVFWSGFEQAGSSMNLFAKVYTQRNLSGENLMMTLTDSSFAQLKRKGIPDSILASLDQLKGQKFRNKEGFITETSKRLTEQNVKNYRSLILASLQTSGGSFELTGNALEKMKNGITASQTNIPATVLTKLEHLKGVKVDGKDKFMGMIEKAIGLEDAQRYASTITKQSLFSWEAPASWLQSINPIFIILLAPFFGWLWVWLASREPSIPAKFAFGLLLLAAGFLVMSWASNYVSYEEGINPAWLIATYFLHTTGELCLSPVGLSSITKLSPKHLVGQMMGIWFMGAALGNLIAGLVAGEFETLPLVELFGNVALITGICGIVFLLIAGIVQKKLIGNINIDDKATSA